MNETREQRATRRRWINLAELVAVAGVLIGALTLWLNWSDRREDKAEAAATAAAAAKERGRLELSATAEGGDTLRLSDAKHDLTDVTIAFPSALGVSPVRPSGEPVIEADAFTDKLLALTDGGADDRSGRLPVLVIASYVDREATRTARGLYDIIWRTHGRFGRGRALELTGLRLRQRGGDQAALDRAWARAKP